MNGFEAGYILKKFIKSSGFGIPGGIGSDFPKASLNQSLRLGGPTSARRIPRTALTSRDDQPVLVKMVLMVLRVAWVRDGGWK
jgi:hypothetical protein